jgi:hypothetical protein
MAVVVLRQVQAPVVVARRRAPVVAARKRVPVVVAHKRVPEQAVRKRVPVAVAHKRVPGQAVVVRALVVAQVPGPVVRVRVQQGLVLPQVLVGYPLWAVALVLLDAEFDLALAALALLLGDRALLEWQHLLGVVQIADVESLILPVPM